jgi:hypothetical protein
MYLFLKILPINKIEQAQIRPVHFDYFNHIELLMKGYKGWIL